MTKNQTIASLSRVIAMLERRLASTTSQRNQVREWLDEMSVELATYQEENARLSRAKSRTRGGK